MNDDFVIYNETNFDIKPYQDDFNAIFQKIKTTLAITEPLELSLIIVDEQKQLELNRQYRQKDYVADVITFALEEENKVDLFKLTGLRSLGDIFICYEKALAQAAEYNHSPRREFAFLFTHGMLHILGYNHQTPPDEEKMFNLQWKVLNDLQIKRIPVYYKIEICHRIIIRRIEGSNMTEQNNFWADVEKGMMNYLTKYINLFETDYEKDTAEKNPKIEAFLAGAKFKTNFEDLFNFVKTKIKPLFDDIRTEYFQDKKPEEIDQKKVTTLIEVSKLFNAIIPLPRFLNDFMTSAKEASSVDLNKLFVNMMKVEVGELTKIYDDEIKGLDAALDKCITDINNTNDALEIWNLVNQLGLFLQRDIILTDFSVEKKDEKLKAQLENINQIEKDYNEGKIKLPEFNKEKIIEEVQAYHDFVIGLTPEKRIEITAKTTEYRNKVVPLVQIIQCLNDLLMNILIL